jgi:flavin-dependent dehydrogenase
MTGAVRTTFDAVIVGAGVAGSAAAIQLARAGWAVALIERQRFPRRKVCGECLAASNMPLLQALGVGGAFRTWAGPELRRVTLLRGDGGVTAALPSADDERYAWGRALGRETLDGLLVEQAQAAGATVFQPWAVRAIHGTPGAWHCEIRSHDSAALADLHARVVIDAHGSWEDLPTDRSRRRHARSAADLFAFKANFTGSKLPEGVISVLALDGGYGGMVVADGGVATVACCIRRDRLSALRVAAPGVRAGEAVEAWLRRDCGGVERALQNAVRDGPWLTSGPLDPGVHLQAEDGIFRIGNAAGEAHPILGEGMSMALQSAALLASILIDRSGHPGAIPVGTAQAELQRLYAARWRKSFAPRLQLAALFAHVAMRPGPAKALIALLRIWPGLLTHGARWGGKVRFSESTGLAMPPRAPDARPGAVSALRAAPYPPTEEST